MSASSLGVAWQEMKGKALLTESFLKDPSGGLLHNGFFGMKTCYAL
jgi:hypothetical protein